MAAAKDWLLALDITAGARMAAPAAKQIVDRIRRRARQEHTEECAALAELLQIAAWTLFDAERHAQSRVLHRQALALARMPGGDASSIELLILSVMALQEEHLGRPGHALRISSSILARKDLPARVAAIFHVRRARALARFEQRSEALRSLRMAEELLSDSSHAGAPHWAWWFDREELLGQHGLTLAALDDLEGSAALLHEATALGNGPAYRALFATELAEVLARAGAWHETDAQLSSLMEFVPSIGSVRAIKSLARTVRRVEYGRQVPRGLRDSSRHLTMLLKQLMEAPCDPETADAEGLPSSLSPQLSSR